MGASADNKPCILAIDDEESLLDIVYQFLGSNGYTVLVAATPKAGLDLYEQRWREIDLVLLDYVMPEMNGEEVFEHMQRINPDVRVLLLTAYDNHVANRMFERGLRGYVGKPFYLDDLLKKVREQIEAE